LIREHQKTKTVLIGNDIIALNDPDNLRSFSNHRYLEKVFTQTERSFINEFEDPHLPQLFWTLKESVYKTLVKMGCRYRFCPINLEIDTERIRFNQQIVVQVSYKAHLIVAKAFQFPDYIHSIAATDLNEIERINYKVFEIKPLQVGAQSHLVREFFIANYARDFSVSAEDLNIHSDYKTGVPAVVCNGIVCNIDLSFTHDGVYVAYAYSGC